MRILLIGKAGSGKDEVAEYLVKRYKFNRYAFADKLKEIASELIPELYQNDRRRMLQEMGVKMRELDEDCWVKYVLNQIRQDTIFDSVITDCRFKNEYELCIQEGFTPVRISCDDQVRRSRMIRRDGKEMTPEEMAHVSEQLNVPCFFEIDNSGTWQVTRVQIDYMINEIRRKEWAPVNR